MHAELDAGQPLLCGHDHVPLGSHWLSTIVTSAAVNGVEVTGYRKSCPDLDMAGE
jgi:hypothetical protein